MKLKCQTCNTEKEFKTHKEAFAEVWDFPPMCPVTTCGECPSAPLVMGKPSTLKGLDAGKGLVNLDGIIPTNP